jgi:hypothetical protein
MIERILTVGGFTLLSRATGFARDIILAAVLGAGPWPTPSSWLCGCPTTSAPYLQKGRSTRRLSPPMRA